MKQRWQPPDPIGLSVIDLLCCAFIAVYVLNLQLADAGDASSQSRRLGRARAVTADLEAKISPPPALGVRLMLGDREAWSTRQDENSMVVWAISPYSTRAFLRGPIPAGSCVDVFLLEAPADRKPVKVSVSPNAGIQSVVELSESAYFRAHLPLPSVP